MSVERARKFIKQGVQRKRKGSLDEACKSFQRAISADKSNPEAWSLLGDVYFQQQAISNAESCYLNAINLNPLHINALNKLGVIFHYSRKYGQAIKYYQRILDAQPDNAAVHYNIGISYIEHGDRHKAVEHVRKSIKINPNNTDALVLLGSVLTTLGAYERAIDSYRAARSQNPERLDAIGGESCAKAKLNDLEAAYDLIRCYVESGCDDKNIVMAYAMTAKYHKKTQSAVELLEKVLKQSGQENKQNAQLSFMAGQLCDDIGDFERAFKHYSNGNSLMQYSYNKDTEKEYIDRIINAFSKENIAHIPNANQEGIVPVFVLGMPRSGTSLVEKILSSHSNVYAAGEIGDIQGLISVLRKRIGVEKVYPEIMDQMNQEAVDALALEYLNKWSEISKPASVIVNKLPHNFMYIGFIYKLFPNAKFIHCTRDPLDMGLSNYFQLFSGPLDYSYDLTNIGHHYLNYKKIMEHWSNVLPDILLEINYEALINDQVKFTRQIIEYCELDWEDSCLSFYESKYVTRTASNEQVRQPIHNRSVQRWRNYEKYLDPLKKSLEKGI